jgi:desulfoferrodoxin-like iron-binding protein
MAKVPDTIPAEWNLEEWEHVLNINVGASYACRACGNLVMVTRGGVGVLDLRCCGQPMQRVVEPRAPEEPA